MMLSIRLHRAVLRHNALVPRVIFAAHTSTCPAHKKGKGAAGEGGTMGLTPRALKSGKVRLAFIPEEWFMFFHSKTGVSGPYVFGIVLANYLFSKEIFIMEHEYYTGLSWIVIVALGVKVLGKGCAKFCDSEIDKYTAEFEKERQNEADMYNNIIKSAQASKQSAEGQKLLIDAKKENVLMQLEAIYRERAMLVYRTVKGRMDYHMKKVRSENRIQQKWMLGWILKNVMKSITPDFQKQALDAAIRDLSAAASVAK